jgi:hypothetical protein
MCGDTISSAVFGSAASGGTAATSGFFGSAGSFGLAQAAKTIGTGLTLAGQISSASAASDLKKEQAKLLEQQKAFDLKRNADEAAQLKSRQRVAAAKSGVKTSGSVLEIMRESAEIAEETALQIELGADSAISSKLFEAKASTTSGNINAASTLLTSFGDF